MIRLLDLIKEYGEECENLANAEQQGTFCQLMQAQLCKKEAWDAINEALCHNYTLTTRQ